MNTGAAQLAAFVQEQQAVEAQQMEEKAVEAADAGAADALAVVTAGLAASWVAKVGAWNAAGASAAVLEAFLADLRRQVRAALAGLADRSARVLRGALGPAVTLGGRQGADFATRLGHRPRALRQLRPPRDALDAADTLARDVDRQVHTALNLLTPAMVRRLGGLRGALTGIGAARRAISMVRSRIVWAVHRAINDGVSAVADSLGLGRLWVAEPTACPTCRAYSGRYAKHGDDFPGGISLDPRQRAYFPDPIPGPPRHPNCRCRAVPWLPAFGNALPNRLKAQARAA